MISVAIMFRDREKISVILFDRKHVKDSVDLLFNPAKGDFGTLLIGAIDKILKRNSISLLSSYTVSIGGFIEKSSLSYGVAVACAAAFNWSYRQMRKMGA